MGSSGIRTQTSTQALNVTDSCWGDANVGHQTTLGTGYQRTESYNHAWPIESGMRGDVGGPFSTIKDSYEGVGSNGKYFFEHRGSPAYWIRGPLFAVHHTWDTASGVYPSVQPSSYLQMMAFGTTAIARCLPTNPIANLSVALGDLTRDGLPRAIGSSFVNIPKHSKSLVMKGELSRKKLRSRNPRKFGDEYLNYQFAWLPFVSDLKNLCRATVESEKILKQYRRDSGRDIHRSYRFPTETTQEVTVGVTETNPICAGGMNFFNFVDPSPLPTITITNTTKVERWFSGCFTYHLDVGTNALSKLKREVQEANKLLGVRITPEVLWELTPWSWAADWVTNMGDILHNLSAFQSDGLVMRYGYIMEHKTSTRTYSVSGYKPSKQASTFPLAVSQTFTRESKIRYGATPFGFGLDPGSFSNRQWAIIAALGISRKPRAL